MQSKKSHTADLERKRGIHFFTGIAVALSLVLISFEWTRPQMLREVLNASTEIDYYNDIIITTREPEPEALEKPKLPQVIEVLLMTEDPVLEDFNPDWEVDGHTRIIWDTPAWNEPEIIDEPERFIIVEDMPTFRGQSAYTGFPRYIAEQLVYPMEAIENGIEGKVYVQFVINEKGKLVEATIYRSVHPVLDKEALRVVNTSPDWTPGMQRGKKVAVQFVFPISFVLQ